MQAQTQRQVMKSVDNGDTDIKQFCVNRLSLKSDDSFITDL